MFPELKNKHLEKSLFSAEDFVDYNDWNKKNFPKKIILIYQTIPFEYFKKKFKTKYRTIDYKKGSKIYIVNDIGLVRTTGIGSPNAAAILEELIVLGAKEIINLGGAGGLTGKGVYLCNKALIDEGTSHHYAKKRLYSFPNRELTAKLKKTLTKNKINFNTGSTWTTDGLYRETPKAINCYKNIGIKTVDMEASALFSVAKARKIKVASLFIVSDIIGNEKWSIHSHELSFKETFHKLLDASIQCLKG